MDGTLLLALYGTALFPPRSSGAGCRGYFA
jgi:hypothetical protein